MPVSLANHDHLSLATAINSLDIRYDHGLTRIKQCTRSHFKHVLTLNVMHFERQPTLALDVLSVAPWLVLAADFTRQVLAAPDRTEFVKQFLGYPIYLATFPFVFVHSPWLLAVPLLVGFVLQLRRIAAGHALTFALVLFTFIGVLATAGVVYAEQDEPESTLREWPTAASWAIAHLIHLRGYSPGNPVSDDGIALSFVLAICGLVVAALITAQLVSWVVGSHRYPTPRTTGDQSETTQQPDHVSAHEKNPGR